MKNYFKILLSNSNEASSRRFIALLTLPFYLIGIAAGIYKGITTGEFRFYLTAIVASAIPVFLAYFSLTWEHVKEILNTKLFNKKSNSLYGMTDDEFKDP